jgi:phenylacetate-CoA ligase
MHEKSRRALHALQEFYASDLDEVLARHRSTDLAAHLSALVRGVIADVPAYRRFLRERGFDRELRTLDDFGALPLTSKDTYHRPSKLSELCRGGIENADFVAVSSGSTGEPAVWPRFASDEIGTTRRFEQVLRDAFGAQHRRTLGVVCFALGTWVGGMYTTAACRHLAAKGYPITLATPGNQIVEILRVVRALASEFEQVVLFGYPPFLKDVIDAGRADGLDWSKLSVRIATAGEVFTEEWRELMCERLGGVDPIRSSASLYGTADGGVLANETPLSIAIRRRLARDPEKARALFGESRLPTLCQYDPLHRYFERVDDELVFTGDGTTPLVRYRILDRGGVIDFRALIEAAELAPQEIGEARDLPFVFVFGRSGFALSFYGANVYPENVSVGLEDRELAPFVTGKFVMRIETDADQNHALAIVVELAENAAESEPLLRAIERSIRRELERLNSEFRTYVPDERRTPRIELRPRGDAGWFPLGVKHRYTRKD